jgi:hypothetical protein
MSHDVPAVVRIVTALFCGMPWPEADEQGLAEHRDAFRKAANGIENVQSVVAPAAGQVLAVNKSEPMSLFAGSAKTMLGVHAEDGHVTKAGSPESRLASTVTLCHELADELDDYLVAVKATKALIVEQAVELLAFGVRAMAAGGLFGPAATAMALKTFMTRRLTDKAIVWLTERAALSSGRMLARLTRLGVTGLAHGVVGAVGFEGRFAAAKAAYGGDVTFQEFVAAGEMGAIGGVVSHAAGHVLGKSMREHLGDHVATDYVTHLAAGTVGAGTAQAALTGEVTWEGALSGTGTGVAHQALRQTADHFLTEPHGISGARPASGREASPSERTSSPASKGASSRWTSDGGAHETDGADGSLNRADASEEITRGTPDAGDPRAAGEHIAAQPAHSSSENGLGDAAGRAASQPGTHSVTHSGSPDPAPRAAYDQNGTGHLHHVDPTGDNHLERTRVEPGTHPNPHPSSDLGDSREASGTGPAAAPRTDTGHKDPGVPATHAGALDHTRLTDAPAPTSGPRPEAPLHDAAASAAHGTPASPNDAAAASAPHGTPASPNDAAASAAHGTSHLVEHAGSPSHGGSTHEVEAHQQWREALARRMGELKEAHPYLLDFAKNPEMVRPKDINFVRQFYPPHVLRDPALRDLMDASGAVAAHGLVIVDRQFGPDMAHPRVHTGTWLVNMLYTHHHGEHTRDVVEGTMRYANKLREVEPHKLTAEDLVLLPIAAALHDAVQGNNRGNDEHMSAALAVHLMDLSPYDFTELQKKKVHDWIAATTFDQEKKSQSVDPSDPGQVAIATGDLFPLVKSVGPMEGISLVCEDFRKRGLIVEGGTLREQLEYIGEHYPEKWVEYLEGQVAFFKKEELYFDPRVDEWFPGRKTNSSFMEGLLRWARNGMPPWRALELAAAYANYPYESPLPDISGSLYPRPLPAEGDLSR